jgi:hypothetical protein
VFYADYRWPAVEQLSPVSFSDQIEIRRARFFRNGSRPRQAMPDRQNYGNHICFFFIALADHLAAYLEQFLSVTKE